MDNPRREQGFIGLITSLRPLRCIAVLLASLDQACLVNVSGHPPYCSQGYRSRIERAGGALNFP
jgi:hypothetical protein